MDPASPDHSQPTSWWNGATNIINFFKRIAEGEGVAAISEAVAPAGEGAPASRERLVAGTEELSQRTDRFLEAAEKLFTALRGPQDKGEALPCAEVKMDEVTRDGAIQSLHLSLDAIRQANLDPTYTTGGSGFANVIKGTVCDDVLLSRGVDTRQPTIFMPYDGNDESWGTTGRDIHVHVAGRSDPGVKVLHGFNVAQDFIAAVGNSLLTDTDTVSFDSFSGEAGSYVIRRETDRFDARWTRIEYDADGDRQSDATWMVPGHNFGPLNIIGQTEQRGDSPSPQALPLPPLKENCGTLPCNPPTALPTSDNDGMPIPDTQVTSPPDDSNGAGATGGDVTIALGGDGQPIPPAGNDGGSPAGSGNDGDGRPLPSPEDPVSNPRGDEDDKEPVVERPSHERVTQLMPDLYNDMVHLDKAAPCGTSTTSVHAHEGVLSSIGGRIGRSETPLQLVESSPAAELNLYVPLADSETVVASSQRDVFVLLPEERRPGGRLEIDGFQSGSDTLGAFYFSKGQGAHSVKEGDTFDGTPQQWILYQEAEGPWLAQFDNDGDGAADFTVAFRDGAPVAADILVRGEDDTLSFIDGYKARPFTLQQKLEYDADTLRLQAREQIAFTSNEAEGSESLETAGVLNVRNAFTHSLMGDIKHNDLGLHRSVDTGCAPVVILGAGNIDLVTGSANPELVAHFAEQKDGGSVVFWGFDSEKDGVAIFGAKGEALAETSNSRTPTALNQVIFYEMKSEEAAVFVAGVPHHQLHGDRKYVGVEFHGEDGDGKAEFTAILETDRFTTDNIHLIA
ncbi:hypothetical protein FHS85_003609 [Rhodoligotrophos appendicifer]|uniref:hypothetical protein n=1 Tax=Rhodoligotrophos appendicifer TaxID=987056 RepID=UPI0011870D71|nr:hypothetical protein [Rhodoligotrophos appendicifer]